MATKKKSSKPNLKRATKPRKQLGHDKSLAIVIKSIKHRSDTSREITTAARVGEFLSIEKLPGLRHDFEKHVKAHGFSFDPARIRIQPHHTVADLAETISGLAGNTTTDD